MTKTAGLVTGCHSVMEFLTFKGDMMKKILFNVFLPLALNITFIVTLTPAIATDWSYSNKDTGPEKWGELSAENILCKSGKNQSPVDIASKEVLDIETRGVKFNYGLIRPDQLINTGELLQLTVQEGTNIVADGIKFELKRLDFHIPSENTLDGKHFPMEIEFIHASKDNQLAIVSVMVVPGRPDRTLRKLQAYLPLKAGQSNPLPANALRNLEMKKKLGNYYRYSGSSTLPPCTEGVHWFIMKDYMSQSKEQYEAFKAAIKTDNNRPVQKRNARLILE